MAGQGSTKHLIFKGTDGHFKHGKKYTYKEYASYIGIKRNTLVTRLRGRQVVNDIDLRASGVPLNPERKTAEKIIYKRLETAADIVSQKHLRMKLI